MVSTKMVYYVGAKEFYMACVLLCCMVSFLGYTRIIRKQLCHCFMCGLVYECTGQFVFSVGLVSVLSYGGWFSLSLFI